MSELEPTIFHLIGMPGVGKYTIAQELVARTGARLVDNHAIANVVFNVLAVDGVSPLPHGTFKQVGLVRDVVMETVKSIAPPHLSYVFTNVIIGENEKELAIFKEFVAMADARGSRFVPVLLRCQTEELVRRVVSPARQARMKLVNPVEATRFNEEMAQFETDHPNALKLDVTHLAPGHAVDAIIEWARSRPAGPTGGERTSA